MSEIELRHFRKKPMLIFNLASPPQDPNLTLEWFKAFGPIVAALLATAGVCLTIWWSMRKGREDARFAYASKALDLRLRQMMDFYAPLRLQIEQSRILYDKLKLSLEQLGDENPVAKIPLKGFRLVDHAYRILNEDQFKEVKPLVEGIIQTGDGISELIGKHGALAEGGITRTLINYRAHLLVLKAASKQPLKFNADDKSLESGYYYPNMLNREVTEGYKEVLRHFEVFQEVGDEVAWKLLGRVPSSRRKDFTDLLENLQYYESNAEAYAAKFDTFDLTELRTYFLKQVSHVRTNTSNGGKPLDPPLLLEVGCGTGRDTTAFIRDGYRVTAFDISPAMVRLSNRRIREERNNPASQIADAAKNSSCIEMSFDELTFRNQFDAAWASASLLHVPKKDLQAVLQRLVRALKQNGVLFISFKYGEGEAEFDSRHYSYFKPDEIRQLMNGVPLTTIDEIWLTDKDGKRLSSWNEWLVSLGWSNAVASGCWVNVLAKKRRN